MRKLKKGFTLVELLVVIAILAILATVSVVGYFSFTEKAEVSNDQSLLKQLNTILLANEAEEGKNQTCSDAISDCEDAGFSVEKISPTASGYNILWDSVNDCFVYEKDGTIEYVSGNEPSTKPDSVAYFKIYNESNTYSLASNASSTSVKLGYKLDNSNSSAYSIYLGTGAIDTTSITKDTPLTVQVGLDTGDNSISYIEYTGTSSSVIIRSNSGSTILTIVSSSKISVYGKYDTVKVEESSTPTCIINATISVTYTGNAKVELDSSANVDLLYVNGSSATVTNNGGSIADVIASSDDIKNSLNISGVEVNTLSSGESINDVASKVCRIGKTRYTTLLDAIVAASDGDTITLVKDISDETVKIGSNNTTLENTNISITIDFNGHFLNNGLKMAYETVNLKLIDSFADCGGGIKSSSKGLEASCNVTIENICIISSKQCIDMDKGNLIIKNAYIENTKASSATNSGNAIYLSGTSSAEIISGKFKANSESPILNIATTGEVIIKGGTFNGFACVKVNGTGTYTIEGGTFSSTDEADFGDSKALCVMTGSITILGGVFSGERCISNQGTVNINGGSFYSSSIKDIDILYANNTAYVESEKADIIFNVTGGTFSQDPSNYLSSNYEAKQNSNGSYTVSTK